MKRPLKIISFNMHKGFNFFKTTYTLMQMRETFKNSGADIILLQELVGWNKEYARVSQLETLADQIWPHHSYGKNSIADNHHHGNAILSRYPITNTLNTSITNNKLEQRGVLYCEITIPEQEKKLHIYNTHLDLLHHSRTQQIVKIIEKYQKQKHASQDPIIVAGDFNDWGRKLSHMLEAHDFKEAHKFLHKKYCRTFPTYKPMLSLDRMYFKNLTPTTCESLSTPEWKSLSDHLPLCAQFDIF